MFTTFVFIALLCSLFIATFGLLFSRHKRLGQSQKDRAHLTSSSPPQQETRPKILSVEAFHTSSRGRYVLACTAPKTILIQEDTSWATRICLDLLERTGAHVILLEVFDTSHRLRFQRLVTSDRQGWTGERFDKVGVATWRTDGGGGRDDGQKPEDPRHEK